MKVEMIDGQVIENVRIKKAPTSVQRIYGYTTMAHWIDGNTKMAYSVPVERIGRGRYRERWLI